VPPCEIPASSPSPPGGFVAVLIRSMRPSMMPGSPAWAARRCSGRPPRGGRAGAGDASRCPTAGLRFPAVGTALPRAPWARSPRVRSAPVPAARHQAHPPGPTLRGSLSSAQVMECAMPAGKCIRRIGSRGVRHPAADLHPGCGAVSGGFTSVNHGLGPGG